MMKIKKSLLYFIGFLKKYTIQECVLVFLMFLTSLGTLVSPYVLKIIIDDVFPAGDYALLVKVLSIYLGISIVRIVIMHISTYMFESVSNNIMKDIRMNVFSHLIRLPLSFFNDNKTGDIIHRVNSEVNSIQNILTGSVVRLINSLCTVIGLTVMLSLLNWKLFIISLVLLPFIYLNTRFFQPKIHKNIKKSRQKDSDILSHFVERFTNIRMIKSFMKYRYEEKNLEKNILEQIDLNMKSVLLSSLTRNISLLITALVPFIILLIGGKDVMLGVMTIGSLVAFIQYTNRLFDPLRDLMGLYFDMVRASVSMDRIYDIMKLEPENSVLSLNPEIESNSHSIEFRNVSFSYGAEPVLKEIDLIFEQGKKYALVGASGSGKSTIINLLCRFYEPDRGDIFIGSRDIRSISLETLRKNINLISQDNHLFHDTIRNNIDYGGTASSEKIEEAVRISGFMNHMAGMPRKMEEVIGDHGVTLSGGQKQRIAIARAVLKTTDIIVLDEATSAMDSETEKELITNLWGLYRGKTIIVVSHRLSTIRHVDEVVCIDRGSVVEKGRHEDLLRNRGPYWKLFHEQIH